MASRVEGFDEKILACAKEEFLEKGFMKASLRNISAKAELVQILFILVLKIKKVCFQQL